MNPKTIQLFWKKVDKTESCWLWKSGKNHRGYGLFWNGSKMVPAHKFSYQLENHYDERLTLDHLCRNRDCVNPQHLEPVTQRENVYRGIGITAKNRKKTHCKNGHELSGDNLYIHNNQRKCKECRRESWRRWFARQ